MQYRMEVKSAFRAVGIKLTTTMESGQCYEAIPKFWQAHMHSGRIAQIASLLEGEPHGMLGISCCDTVPSANSTFDYYIAAPTHKAPPPGMEELIIPEATWAIFACIGPIPTAIQDLQRRIVTEWLPTSGYEYGNAPDIEVYFDEDGSQPDTRSEIWIPVRKA